MSLIKSKQEIDRIREGGKILHQILRETAKLAVPGASTWDLNWFAESQIIKAGGRPSFKGYGGDDHPFPAALCTSVNAALVHGMPSKEEILAEGDIIGLDIGMEYKGLYTDTAITVGIGKISPEAKKLLEVTESALSEAIKIAKVGNTVGDIAAVTQEVAEAAGFNVVRDLVGHGVGHDVHEDPQVPNFGKRGTGMKLREGMVLAIEPMVTAGSYKLELFDDGWTIGTKDGSLSAHFEHTVAITKNGPQILT
jgi:methionyl aminopeptidase